ncbi:hypothetical protein BCR43DRAFT_260363 [Syncephalastrum racemosum]|uniref:Uncharacterized protein n=1 Tax=Syncephalastrum racemosum TaxID=13706 RepID=A0A1X2HGN9_SYNRA|nr:hypothetical protein BCR43DRAFT_260363 [Syncephalastrum racemosum]
MSTTFYVLEQIRPSILSEVDSLLTVATLHDGIRRKAHPLPPTQILPLDYVRHITKSRRGTKSNVRFSSGEQSRAFQTTGVSSIVLTFRARSDLLTSPGSVMIGALSPYSVLIYFMSWLPRRS